MLRASGVYDGRLCESGATGVAAGIRRDRQRGILHTHGPPVKRFGKSSALKLFKAHCLSNDFLVADGVSRPLDVQRDFVARLACRRKGLGCDQLLVMQPPRHSGDVLSVDVYNADGSVAGNCINGGRCVLLSALSLGLIPASLPAYSLQIGDYQAQYVRDQNDQIVVQTYLPAVETLSEGQFRVVVGNEHIIQVEDALRAPAADHRYPEANVTIASRIGHGGDYAATVFERGTGETPACGSSSLALAATLQHIGHSQKPYSLRYKGGNVLVSYPETELPDAVRLSAEAHVVAECTVAI